MKRHSLQWLSAMGLGTALICGTPAFAADERPAERPARRAGPPPAGERGPGMRAGSEEWFNRWSAELKLTEAQKQKIQALRKEQREQGDKIRQDTSLTPEQRREKMRALRQENDKKMKEILTTEQYEKWQQSRPRRAGALDRNVGEPPVAPGSRPNRAPQRPQPNAP